MLIIELYWDPVPKIRPPLDIGKSKPRGGIERRMRAVRYHEAGDPSVLQIEEIDRPEPGNNEIVVKIRAASINPTDAKRRKRGSGPFPKTTGSDFSGIVESVGVDIAGFEPGDRVCGTGLHTTRFHQGSFAEYVAVPPDVVTQLPDNVSFEDGAAVALVGVTAWWGLIDHGGLKPTDECLIHGGTGGVGHIAVQLSHLICAHTVTTTQPDRQRDAELFGADAVLSYDHDNLLEAVSAHSDHGYDVIFDHRWHDYFTFDIEAAAFDGTIVHYGGVDEVVELSKTARENNLSIHAMTMSNLVDVSELPSISSILDRVLDLVDQGEVTPAIARTYRLEDAAEAHRSIMEDSFIGKIVVIP